MPIFSMRTRSSSMRLCAPLHQARMVENACGDPTCNTSLTACEIMPFFTESFSMSLMTNT